MDISISEAHNRLSFLLKQVHKGPILINRRGRTVGVLISPEEYEKLSRVGAYLTLLEVSKELAEGPSAAEIYRTSRQELEERS